MLRGTVAEGGQFKSKSAAGQSRLSLLQKGTGSMHILNMRHSLFLQIQMTWCQIEERAAELTMGSDLEF